MQDYILSSSRYVNQSAEIQKPASSRNDGDVIQVDLPRGDTLDKGREQTGLILRRLARTRHCRTTPAGHFIS